MFGPPTVARTTIPQANTHQPPDFAKGVAVDKVPDGGILAGKVGDDAVLLTRNGTALRAFSATCTHLGAPLGDGLVVNGAIRCPWHHACFDLANGHALAAPAFEPLRAWDVEQREGIVTVTHKETIDEPSAVSAVSDPRRFVIVGGGAAGYAAAFELRRQGFDGSVTMVTNDSSAAYDRTLLTKDYLDGKFGDDHLPIAGPSLEQLKIEVLTGIHIERIDRSGRRLVLRDRPDLPFAKLLLATGSEPDRLEVPGGDRPHVLTLRSLEDCRSLLRQLASARKVVVVGSSFIGLEAAASIRTRGHDVTIVTPERESMASKIGPELSNAIVSAHRAKGVAFKLETKVMRIDPGAVVLDDGTTLPADVVVVGIGVKPRTALAKAAGLATDDGVRVDAQLRTDDPDIFAAGDIARWPDARSGKAIRVEHWVVAQRQGQTAARTMLGSSERYRSVPFFWSKHFDLSFRYVGHAEHWDAIVIEGDLEKREATLRFRKDGRDLAVATVGQDRQALQVEREMEADQAL